jgi:hypothetical protein
VTSPQVPSTPLPPVPTASPPTTFAPWESLCRDELHDGANGYDVLEAGISRHDGLGLYVFRAVSSGPEWFGREWEYRFDADHGAYRVVVGRHADGGLISYVTGPGVAGDNQVSESATSSNEGDVNVAIETEWFPQLGTGFDWSVVLVVEGVEHDICVGGAT